MPGTLETNGAIVSDTLANFDDYDDIVYSVDFPDVPIALNITAGGTASLADEIGPTDTTIMLDAGVSVDLTMGAGNDVFYDNEESNTFRGGVGNDTFVSYGTGPGDTFLGGNGNDSLFGGTGADVLNGGSNDDYIIGGGGQDTVIGGDGADVILAVQSGSVNGGDGQDEFWINSFPDLTEISISNVEVLVTQGSNVIASLAQFESFETITVDPVLPENVQTVTLTIEAGGTADLSDELGGRNVYVISQMDDVILTTGSGDDLFQGGQFRSEFYGGLGNDSFYGGRWPATGPGDEAYGGAGNDSLWGSSTDDLLDGGADNDALYGAGGADSAYGGAGDDLISQIETGVVDGGTGTDVFSVQYYTDLTGISFTGIETLETLGQATRATLDQLDGFTSIIYMPGAEPGWYQVYLDLAGGGTADLSDELGAVGALIYADEAETVLTTGSGNDYVLGGEFRVEFHAGAGDDTFASGRWAGTGAGDVAYGGAGNDSLYGAAMDDLLYGGANDDFLDGGTGNDTLNGGAGSDTANLWYAQEYWTFTGSVQSFTATSTLFPGWEIRLVGIEFVNFGGTLVSTGSLGLPGNIAPEAEDDSATVVAGATLVIAAEDLLANDADPDEGPSPLSIVAATSPGAGFTVSVVDGDVVVTVADWVGAGTYSVTYSVSDGDLVSAPATISVEVTRPEVTIIGTEGADRIDPGRTVAGQPLPTDAGDVIITYGGADRIDGGLGADTMEGGQGNDIYVVEDAGDTVVEVAGGGTDRVSSVIDHTLADNVEVLRLVGSAVFGGGNGGNNAIYGTGLDNELAGNAGNDKLFGQGGDDRLNGGLGNDLLNGGTGEDTFVFDLLGAGRDRIADFAAGIDAIEFDAAVFTGLVADVDGTLLDGMFRLGTVARDADDRILYDQATGRLFYDADGTGSGARVQVAILTGAPVLTASDILIG